MDLGVVRIAHRNRGVGMVAGCTVRIVSYGTINQTLGQLINHF